MRLLQGSKILAIDTETTGLNPRKGARPFSFQFCNWWGETAYYEFDVDPRTREVLYKMKGHELAQVREVMTNPNIVKVFFHAKFDIRHIEAAIGEPIQGKIVEVMFESHVCNTDEFEFGLKPLAKKYADYPDDDQKELLEAVHKLRRKAMAINKKAEKEFIAKYGGLTRTIRRPGKSPIQVQFSPPWKLAENASADYWLVQYARELLDDRKLADEFRKRNETYGCGDGIRTMLLHRFYLEKMKELKVRRVYDKEMRLWPTIRRMEDRGVRIRPSIIADLRIMYAKQAKAELAQILAIAKKFKMKDFNPGSHQQLSTLLYDKMKMEPPIKRGGTKGSKSSRPVDKEALLELSVQTPLCDMVLRHRAFTKANSFLDDYENRMEWDEERKCWLIHAEFRQLGPKTGRLACAGPNLQQTASKSSGGQVHAIDMRVPFGPSPRCVWFKIDYSQVEVRIFADLLDEQTMKDIIHSGQHIHKACSNKVWGGYTEKAIRNAKLTLFFGNEKNRPKTTQLLVDELAQDCGSRNPDIITETWLKRFKGDIVAAEESIDVERTKNKAKRAVFTRTYGGGVPSIMNILKCSREEAQELINDYGEAFPDMDPNMRAYMKQAGKDGYIRTAFGRRIPIDRKFSYRAVNYVVQGSAADLMKHALINCQKYIDETGIRAWIVMTIHDEIVFEFERSEEKVEHVKKLKAIMEDHGGAFTVPMPCDVKKVTKQWNQPHSVGWAK